MNIRILVVDDSAFMRRVIRTMLETDSDIEVVATGNNGEEAVALASKLKPDVITLDIEMPVMDGLTALRRIMRDCPTNVLMCSSLTTGGSLASLRALKLGAVDIVAKDASQFSLNMEAVQRDLITRIKAIARQREVCSTKTPRDSRPNYRPGQFSLITIGSSTGGPPILEKLITAIPANFKTPIVIAQHMPVIFTRTMSQRLDDICPLNVLHIEDGMSLESSHIYIAPGGQHTHIRKRSLARWTLEVSDEPQDHIYRPSVDALFSSAAEAVGQRTLGIILTGIGDDGLNGSRELKNKGAHLLAQSANSCVVYGMPRAVTEAKLIDASLAPDDIAATLKSLAPATTNASAA